MFSGFRVESTVSASEKAAETSFFQSPFLKQFG